jgi:hypothetical protein
MFLFMFLLSSINLLQTNLQICRQHLGNLCARFGQHGTEMDHLDRDLGRPTRDILTTSPARSISRKSHKPPITQTTHFCCRQKTPTIHVSSTNLFSNISRKYEKFQ